MNERLNRAAIAESSEQRAKSREVPDILCEFGDCPALLPCAEVEAVCTEVKRVLFRGFGERMVFTFGVAIPQEFAGTKLQMYVRAPRSWKRPPVSSKLFKVVAAACGELPRRRRITGDMFVGKLFRCRLKQVGERSATYSVVETILERLTG